MSEVNSPRVHRAAGLARRVCGGSGLPHFRRPAGRPLATLPVDPAHRRAGQGGGPAGGRRPLVRRGRARGCHGHRASASPPEHGPASAASPPSLRSSIRTLVPPCSTMPAVDKLLLEEALQDSPQVPPAAPVPLARELRPRRPLQPRGGGGAASWGARRRWAWPCVLSLGCPRMWASLRQSWGTQESPYSRILCVMTPFQTQLKLRLPA